MVAKISHGMSLYGALAYNYEKVAAGTAEILSGNRMISDRLGLPSEDMRLASLSFENYLLANRNTEKPVLHISLSPAPEDRLTDGRLAELAERYMQKMGYGNRSGCGKAESKSGTKKGGRLLGRCPPSGRQYP